MKGGQGGRVEDAFRAATAKVDAALIAFVTAGYPTANGTSLAGCALVALFFSTACRYAGHSLGHARVAEPMSSSWVFPYTDYPASQRRDDSAHQSSVAIKAGHVIDHIPQCLAMVMKQARERTRIDCARHSHELHYDPFYQFSIDALCRDTATAGADGFIVVVDSPPEEGLECGVQQVRSTIQCAAGGADQ
jgi:tryptophan synthase alpha subunit